MGTVSWLRRGLPFIVLATLVLLAYGGVIHNGYVWDDRYFLIDYAWLDSASSAFKTAFSPLFQSESYVRPIPLLTLYAEGILSGRNPAISHAVNGLIHLVCVWLVYLIALDAMRWTQRTGGSARWWALALASFFAIHPALSEAVIWVSSRFDLLATMFILLGLWIATRDSWRDWVMALGVACCFLLAALSKESAVVFPLLLASLLTLRQITDPTTRKALFSWLLLPRWLTTLAAGLIAGLAYLLIRYTVLDGFGSAEHIEISSHESIARTLVTLPKYLQLTFIPFIGNSPQHTFSWTAESSIFDYIVPLAITATLILATLALIAKGKPAGWVLLAWLVCYLPVMHLLTINVGNNSIQQRFMYLPTAILLALMPYATADISLSDAARRWIPFLVGILLLACLLVTRSIVPAWRSDLTLWLWADQASPKSYMVRENLIWAYLDIRRFDKVDEEVQRLREDQILTSTNALVNVGVSYYMRGDFEKAIALYEQALDVSHGLSKEQVSTLKVNLSAANAMLGRDADARSMIAAAIRESSANSNHVAIGNLLAFCDGQNVDTQRFGKNELMRAESTRLNMVKLLKERHPSGSWPLLCPDSAALSANEGILTGDGSAN